MSDSVRLVLDVPREVRSGESIRFLVRLTNEGSQPVDLYLRGREIAFDVIVRDRTGREVWSRLHEAIIPAIIRLEHLPPNQTLEFRHTWDLRGNDAQPVRAGPYTALARLLTDGPPLESNAVSVVIRP